MYNKQIEYKGEKKKEREIYISRSDETYNLFP